jgi:uncharacterized protein YyaL (SSP411 family)
VCVELDPLEHPFLDQGAQALLRILAGRGGWPVNLFLDPETGLAVFGATALEPESGAKLLRQLFLAWETQPEDLRAEARASFAEFCARDPLQGSAESALSDREVEEWLSEKILGAVFAPLEQSLDWEHGFVGGGDVFLHPAVYRVLLRKPESRVWGEKALSSLARSQIYDLVGGGFFRAAGRAATDAVSTEKLLVENSEMLETLLAVEGLGRKEFLSRLTSEIIEALGADFLGTNPEAGFAGSRSASSAFYEFRPRDLLEALEGSERQAAQAFFGIEGARLVPTLPTELPRLAKRLGVAPVDLRNDLIRAHTRLVAYRKEQRANVAPRTGARSLVGEAAALRALATAGRLGLLPEGRDSQTREFCRARLATDGAESKIGMERGAGSAGNRAGSAFAGDRESVRAPWAWASAQLALARWAFTVGDRATALAQLGRVDALLARDGTDMPAEETPFLGRRVDACDHLGASAAALRVNVYGERLACALLEGDARTTQALTPRFRRALAEGLRRAKPLGLFAAHLYDGLARLHARAGAEVAESTAPGVW